jgi:hypothetical protein
MSQLCWTLNVASWRAAPELKAAASSHHVDLLHVTGSHFQIIWPQARITKVRGKVA